ncbi:hypothetical protein [Azohydromonas australica]|uniref:hypothetical protein n=1 Tax=Azohydromonas australica TaxID=364039 RepID=UPI00041A8FBD|nr:hypothetical protein [Azohydromonas australica]
MDASPLQAAQNALAAVAQALADAVAEAVQAETAGAASGTPGGTAAQPADALGRLLQREGLAERLLGPAQAAALQEPSGAPLPSTDPAAETAMLQTFGRPQPQNANTAPQPQPEVPAAPAAEGSTGDFALPDAQLAPALLVGLQVDPGYGWMLPQPQPLQERSRTQDGEAEREPAERDARGDDAADEQAPEEDTGKQAPAAPLVFDAADARLDTLLHALHAALCAADAPPALRAAAEQWQRGRIVILACPQRPAPQGMAWAFVLAPQATAGRDGASVRLAGPCFEAWLQWREAPRGARWCHARLVKEHHPRHGRRLVAADASQAAACGVQLGPVLSEQRPPGAVTLRIAAARSFWNALGVQWSALLVVCPLPLAGVSATAPTRDGASE